MAEPSHAPPPKSRSLSWFPGAQLSPQVRTGVCVMLGPGALYFLPRGEKGTVVGLPWPRWMRDPKIPWGGRARSPAGGCGTSVAQGRNEGPWRAGPAAGSRGLSGGTGGHSRASERFRTRSHAWLLRSSVQGVWTIPVPNPPPPQLQVTKRWGGGEGRGRGCHRPRAFFWVEAGRKGRWELRVPKGPPEGFVWAAGSRKLPTLGKFLRTRTRGWVGPATTSPAEGYTQDDGSAATGEGSWGGRILSAPDSVSPSSDERTLLGWWQRTGRGADKTAQVGFNQRLWIPANAWAAEVLASRSGSFPRLPCSYRGHEHTEG